MTGYSFLRPIRRSGRQVTPAVQVGDLPAALANASEMSRQAPTAPKAREMIEQVRIIGQDRLTATDQAIYEAMLAWAREHGLDIAEHRVPLDALKKYAEITRTDDLVAMLHRLGTTHVRFDIRDGQWRLRGTMPLVLAKIAEHEESAEAEVRFSIPEDVRRLMGESRSYAHLELSAFPRFSSRYAPRLYQRLALRAGYSKGSKVPWEIDPLKLATSLGFPISGRFRFPDFRRHALEPALRDISSYVSRFRVEYEPIYKTGGRGRPAVAKLKFSFYDKDFQVPLAARRATPLSALIVREITQISADRVGVIPAHLIPTASTISRLLTDLLQRGYLIDSTEMKALQIFDGWLAAVEEGLEFTRSGSLREDAQSPDGAVDICGEYLLDEISDLGLETALRTWVYATERTGRYMRPRPRPIEHRGAPDEETREEKSIRLTKSIAEHQIEVLPVTTRSAFRMHIAALTDPEVAPWSPIIEHEDIGPSLAAALRIAGRMSDASSQRQTVINLLRAVAEYDLPRVAAISRAVISAAKSTGLTSRG